MNYPVWQLEWAGGGLIIMLMAVIHVYISHFAVGGGLFLVLTEHRARRMNDPAMLAWVHRHTRFFLLLTMVMGSLTGVGIWFTISVLNPAATSVLIHTFVFAWATEWLFFGAEIVSLLIYYYTFERMDGRTHLMIGWIYFGCAWMSLFIINGIIGFMLTPGDWLATGNFWDGLFNPSFWPALWFRTFLALIIAGIFGLFSATTETNERLRLSLVRYSATWLVAPFLLFLLSAWWYRAALPGGLEAAIFERMPEVAPAVELFTVLSAALVLGGLIVAIRLPARLHRALALLMLIAGLFYIGAFEYIREAGRRPFVIHDHMYSNSIRINDVRAVASTGVLTTARWAHHTKITDENRLSAGRELFSLLCLSCHSLNGPMKDIRRLAADATPERIAAVIDSMGSGRPFMPPFTGTSDERDALVVFLTGGLPDPMAIPIRHQGSTGKPATDQTNRYTTPQKTAAWKEKEKSP